MLAGVLLLPVKSWADNHFLDIVVTPPTTVFQQAILTDAGAMQPVGLKKDRKTANSS